MCDTNRINYTSHSYELKYALTLFKIFIVEQLLIQIFALLLCIFPIGIINHLFNLIGITWLIINEKSP
jgi:hypothetical protein